MCSPMRLMLVQLICFLLREVVKLNTLVVFSVLAAGATGGVALGQTTQAASTTMANELPNPDKEFVQAASMASSRKIDASQWFLASAIRYLPYLLFPDFSTSSRSLRAAWSRSCNPQSSRISCCGAYRAMNAAALNFYGTVKRDGTRKAAVETRCRRVPCSLPRFLRAPQDRVILSS
jgi:hypothetical protein